MTELAKRYGGSLYELAKEVYAKIGVDTDKAIEKLKNIKITCFLFAKCNI